VDQYFAIADVRPRVKDKRSLLASLGKNADWHEVPTMCCSGAREIIRGQFPGKIIMSCWATGGISVHPWLENPQAMSARSNRQGLGGHSIKPSLT
jgi:hypothetical protein